MPSAISADEGRTRAEAGIKRLHHIGVAVRDMEATLAYYLDCLGLERLGEPIVVPGQKVRVCFVADRQGALIELVEGLQPGSPVERIVRESGGGPYHLCFEVQSVERAVKSLRRAGFLPLVRFEVPGGGMRRFVFMLTPDRQLIEFCEAGGKTS